MRFYRILGRIRHYIPHKPTSEREVRSFYSFSAYLPDDCKSRAIHFRGHAMLQSRRSSHVEACIGRMYPYVGHRVESAKPKNARKGVKVAQSRGQVLKRAIGKDDWIEIVL